MLSLDQIERELKAIETFDRKLLAENCLTAEEMIGFKAREMRRRELLNLLQTDARNTLT